MQRYIEGLAIGFLVIFINLVVVPAPGVRVTGFSLADPTTSPNKLSSMLANVVPHFTSISPSSPAIG